MLGSCGLQTARSRRADFIPTIQVAAVSVRLNTHGVHMRQLHGQRKILNLKDSTGALLAKSRQWWNTGQIQRERNHTAESLEAVVASYTEYDYGIHVVRGSVDHFCVRYERKASEGGNASAQPCVTQRTPLWLLYIWAGRGPRFSKVPGNLRTIFALPAHRA